MKNAMRIGYISLEKKSIEMKKYSIFCSLILGLALSAYSQSNVIDFTSPSTVTFGEGAQVQIDGIMMLRAGNANGDDSVQYDTTQGDIVAMIDKIGANTQSLIVPGYSKEDVNLDGYIKLNGSESDRVFLLNVVGFFTPFFVIQEQLP